MKRALTWLLLGASAIGSAVGLNTAASGRPILPAERRFSPYTGFIPACDDPRVLDRITYPFKQRESEDWDSKLEIRGYDHIVQQGYRSAGRDHIPRRYCTAVASLNNARRHSVVYWVGENTDYAGYDYGVEWCIVGLDRNLSFGPDCRAARP